MTWVRLSDDWYDHPKFLAAEADGFWLWAACLAWSNHHKTNGLVPDAIVQRFVQGKRKKALVARLLRVCLWEPTEGGYRIHDYLHYQPSAEEIASEREQAALRKELYSNPTLQAAIRERDKDRCRYCGRNVNWKDRKSPLGATYSRVDPTEPNTVENIVVSCRGCSAAKAGRSLKEAGMKLLIFGTRSELDPELDPDQIGTRHPNPHPNPSQKESISESPIGEGSGGDQKAAADAAGEGLDKGKDKSKRRSKPRVDLTDPRIDEVWTHYRMRIQPRAKVCPREDIGRRLLTFSVGDLKSAIDHFAKDAFYGASQKHRGASLLFCRSDQKTEEFVNLVPRETLLSNGKAKDQSVADAGKRYEYAK
ncbi:MAG: HNH endonuclease [Sphingomonadaceae bacterium]